MEPFFSKAAGLRYTTGLRLVQLTVRRCLMRAVCQVSSIKY